MKPSSSLPTGYRSPKERLNALSYGASRWCSAHVFGRARARSLPVRFPGGRARLPSSSASQSWPPPGEASIVFRVVAGSEAAASATRIVRVVGKSSVRSEERRVGKGGGRRAARRYERE